MRLSPCLPRKRPNFGETADLICGNKQTIRNRKKFGKLSERNRLLRSKNWKTELEPLTCELLTIVCMCT